MVTLKVPSILMPRRHRSHDNCSTVASASTEPEPSYPSYLLIKKDVDSGHVSPIDGVSARVSSVKLEDLEDDFISSCSSTEGGLNEYEADV